MRKKGFTLIEILIVIALSSILLDVIYNIYQKNNNNFDLMNVKSSLYKKNLQALDRIRLDIKKSHQVVRNYNSFSSGTDSIVLQLPKLDSSDAPIANQYYYIVYTANTTTRELIRHEIIDSVQTNKVINSYCDNLTFTYKDNLSNTLNISNIETASQIKIDLTLEDKSKNQTIHSYLTSNETMRNK